MDAEEHSDHVRGCAENTHVGRKESSEMGMKLNEMNELNESMNELSQ